jgi:hypothetical protein
MSEDPRALSLADCISRVPADRTRIDVPLLELPPAGVPRPLITSTRVFVLTSNDIGICVDDEYTTADSRRQFTDIGCSGCD